MDAELYNAAINDGNQDLSEILRGLAADSSQQVTSQQNNTILHIAATSGNLQIAAEDDHLLRFLYHQNKMRNTPLHIAAKLGHLEMVTTLVVRARKPDVEQNRNLLSMRNSEEDTALHEAVRYNRLEVVKLLIEEDPDLASLVNGAGESPLFMAVDRCFFQVALHILKEAPNCSYQGRNGMNVLHAAVIRHQRRNMFLTIREHFSLFMLWIMDEKFLLEYGLPKSLREPGDKQTDFERELLEKLHSSTLLKKADDFGWIPLHYAAYVGHTKLVELFLMNNNKSLAYTKNKEGMSALHIAAKKGHVDVIRTLIKICPEICELLDDKDRTALHVAVERREEIVVSFFLQSLAFQDLINKKDMEGNTALHLAAFIPGIPRSQILAFQRPKILRMLANDSKIDKGATNKDGMTFFDIILSNKQLKDTDMLEILSTLGIKIGLPSLEQKFMRETKEAAESSSGTDQMRKDEQVEDAVSGNNKYIKPHLDPFLKDFTMVALMLNTLIVTATFTAAFTMPGGYNDQGLAICKGKEEFEMFLRNDVLAFVYSATSLFYHFMVPLISGGLGRAPVCHLLIISLLTGASIVALISAFDHGIKAVFPEKPEFAFDKNPLHLANTFLPTFLYIPLAKTFLAPFIKKRPRQHYDARIRFGLWG